jgi:predicted amidohydrolase YtcJ
MRTLYRAGRVHTLSGPASGEWVLVDDRHVQRVGGGDPPAADRTVDLPGTTIVPGFIDSHVHLTGTGIDQAGPYLGGVESVERLLEVLAAAARDREGATLAHGFDETRWPHARFPTQEELDRASDRPLIAIRADGHVSVANTPALLQAEVMEVPGVESDERGRTTGVVRREANERLQGWFHRSLSDHDVQRYQLLAAGLAASRGVTTVHEMSVPRVRGLRDFEVLMAHRAQLPVDVVPYVASTDIPYVMDAGLSRIGGDLNLDGSIGARTARLSAAYQDDGGTGVSYFDDDALCEFLHNAHLAGLQTALHAIGDAAIDQALRSWERVYHALDSRERRHFRARLHRLEHFEMPDPPMVERAAMLGMAISIQPTFDSEWGHPGGMYERRLGRDRALSMNPFRSLINRGMEVGAGSDSPITALDPMVGIWALENHHEPVERLTRAEAIGLFTSGSARLANLEGKKGKLEPGMQADFAAYEQDPQEADTVLDLRPVLTVSRGREVYAR